MFRRLSFLIILSSFFSNSFSQINVLDTLTHSRDSIFIHSEEEVNKLDMDSIYGIAVQDLDSTASNDSLSEKISYQELMRIMKDSIIFETLDTTHFIISKLSNLIKEDSTHISDSTKQAIIKLSEYIKNQNIEPVLKYLKKEIEDSILIEEDEYIYDAVRFLLTNIQEDSVKILFTNAKSDSVLITVKENQKDSVIFRLYDYRGEFAILWIKKDSTNSIDLTLEDGFSIEKTKRREFVNPTLDFDFLVPELKSVEGVNIVIPIWEFEGSADIRFNQGYVSPSWAEGGENSMSALSVLKYSADYSYGKKIGLDTDVEFRLGYLKAGDNDLQKNDDKFEINAKYGRSAFGSWYYSGLFNFKTQVLKGYDYSNDTTIEVSEFLSPAYMVFSLGLDYKPGKKLTILISPLTSKFTIVADTVHFDQTRFGVGKDELIRKEIGAYIKAISKVKLKDNIILENKVNFFTNYVHNPQNIDIDWETNLSVNLTEYLKLSVNAHFIYDDDVEIPVIKDGEVVGNTIKGQFKELLGIGFIYSF